MGVILAESNLNFLEEYLNKKIPDEDFIFRRVSLEIFLQGQPEHKLEIQKGFFRNEKGDGMSVDWERVCNDPKITQTRDGEQREKYGVVVLSYFDIIRELRERVFRIKNDQKPYDCH